MLEVMNEIMEKFIPIRKERAKPTRAGMITWKSFWISIVALFLARIAGGIWEKSFLVYIAVLAIFVAILSLFAMLLIAEYEPMPNYAKQELKEIKDILEQYKIIGEEKRKLFKERVEAIIKNEYKKHLGMKVFVGVLISPVYAHLIDVALDEGVLFSIDAGKLVIGPIAGAYIEIVLMGLLFVGALNVLHIRLERDNSRKKDLIRAIDEIDFWEKVEGVNPVTTK